MSRNPCIFARSVQKQVWGKMWDKFRLQIHLMSFEILERRLGKTNFVSGALHVIFIHQRP